MAKKKPRSSPKKAIVAAPVKKAAPAPAHAPAAPSPGDVSARAHQIWIARGKPTPGTPVADWLQAERELGVRKS